MNAGEVYRVDCPGHHLHGKEVRIEKIEPRCNIAPDGYEPRLVEMIWVSHPSLGEQIGLGRGRLAASGREARRCGECGRPL